MQETIVLIKPDAFEKGAVDEILNRFLTFGFTVTAMKNLTPTADAINEHYKEKFLTRPDVKEAIIEYMLSGPVIALLLKKDNAISDARMITGPLVGAPAGTIRGDLDTDILRNLVHASDSEESAQKEKGIWFGNGEKPQPILLNERENLFVQAIALKKESWHKAAEAAALKCLFSLIGCDTAEETASGHVVTFYGHKICLPDFLHIGTAEKRFKEAGIL